MSNMKEAWDYANNWMVKIKGSATVNDQPIVQYSALGKLMTMFNTFTINNWNHLAVDVFGSKSVERTPDRVARVTRLLVGTALVSAISQTGLHIHSPFPSPEYDVVSNWKQSRDEIDPMTGEHRPLLQSLAGAGVDTIKEMGYQFPVVGNMLRFSGPSGFAYPPPIQVAQDAYKTVEKLVLRQDLSHMDATDLSAIGRTMGLPGASQTVRFITGILKGQNVPDALMGANPTKYGTFEDREQAKSLKYWQKYFEEKQKAPEERAPRYVYQPWK